MSEYNITGVFRSLETVVDKVINDFGRIGSKFAFMNIWPNWPKITLLSIPKNGSTELIMSFDCFRGHVLC